MVDKYRVVTDQMGERVEVPKSPMRIISLVPSQTELLCDLGLNDRIVGVTRFCIHPGNKVGEKPRIGGTKDFDIDKIKSLKPDLVIGNMEENYEEGIVELKKHFPVWMSDIYTLDDAYEMMNAIGGITNKQEEAKALVSEISAGFDRLSTISLSIRSCAYFIWRKPYMVATNGTFLDHMLSKLGVKNVFGDMDRYPQVSAEDIAGRKPDLIFLSSEPYSFTDRHKAEFRNIYPEARVIIVNGELFSWYGSRLRYTAAYFESLREQISSNEGDL
jgi:ABC-type Fe3+-hydroxamate transport system substrate-binding protein